jgi:hypothetical protein
VFFVKSCIKPISNYWFKTYSFIVSKSNHVLKQIMGVLRADLIFSKIWEKK